MTRHALPPCISCGASGEKVIGHEDQGVYDGVLWWSCEECGWAWTAGFQEGSYREKRAQDRVEQWINERRQE